MSRVKINVKEIWQKYGQKLDLLDINLIISAVLKKPREFVLAHPEYELITNHRLQITNYIKRRIKGEPLAYILGRKEFYGLNFKVDKNVLVPRPETEMMVEEAIKRITHNAQHITIVDVGTGSGCIIITLANVINYKLQITNYKLFGLDISQKALTVARQNAKIHEVNKKIKFLKSDLLNSVIKNKEIVIGNCELIIVANLPYLDAGWKNLLKSTETRGLKFEPRIALYAGKDGLDAYRRLAEQIKTLKEKTRQPITVFCEIGHKQAKGIKKIFSFARNVETKKDLAGLDRLAIIEI